jgi:benzoyl-CoA reductase/2-hydroxyglutaryl-CoA dehydratase subunit BcrC/BadD/HgdB
LGAAASRRSKRFEGQNRVRVDDICDRLHFLADEMTNIDPIVQMEFGQNVEIAGD